MSLRILLFFLVFSCGSIFTSSSLRELRPAPAEKEANVCQYVRYKIDTVQRKEIIKSGSTNEEETNIKWYPWKRRTKYNVFTCCPGWRGYVSGKGCLQKDPNFKRSLPENQCGISLPQHASRTCAIERNGRLEEKQEKLKLTNPAPSHPLQTPLLDMTSQEIYLMHLQDPLQSHLMTVYANMLVKNRNVTAVLKEEYGDKDFQTLDEFRRNTWRVINAAREVSGYMKYPFDSDRDPFRDVTSDDFWTSDKWFVQLRLAGLNPMTIQRITLDGSVGVKFSDLEQVLNATWKTLLKRALRGDRSHSCETSDDDDDEDDEDDKDDEDDEDDEDDDEILEQAIRKHHLYVTQYPTFYNLPNEDEITDTRPSRKMWPSFAPIAIFAIVPEGCGVTYRAVGIQKDYHKDSPVYTPADGEDWLIAKKALEVTDFAYVELVEHLLKTHLTMEPICVVLDRQLSDKHPLHQILKYHCRGLFPANSIGLYRLVGEGMYLDQLFAIGSTGALTLMAREFSQLTWSNTDFREDLRVRGMDTEQLEYFPFRDDGALLYDQIRVMATRYINHFYAKRADIENDYELQAFLNELSADGTGENGGAGRIKGFPKRITCTWELIDLLARIIWLATGKHAAVNYPVSAYGSFTPMAPTKIYDTNIKDSLLWLPNAKHSAVQASVAMGLGSLHFDEIFDYGGNLTGGAREIIEDTYKKLHQGEINNELERRNRERYENNDLTYPFMLARWIPNSIYT